MSLCVKERPIKSFFYSLGTFCSKQSLIGSNIFNARQVPSHQISRLSSPCMALFDSKKFSFSKIDIFLAKKELEQKKKKKKSKKRILVNKNQYFF